MTTEFATIRQQAACSAAEAAGLVTHLMDAVEADPEGTDALRVGHPVQLRTRADGRAVEAWSPCLGRLGNLPRETGEAVASLLEPGAPGLAGVVTALVPRPGRLGGTRIHITLGLPGPSAMTPPG